MRRAIRAIRSIPSITSWREPASSTKSSGCRRDLSTKCAAVRSAARSSLPEGFAAARSALTERFPSARAGIGAVLGEMECIATGLGTLSRGREAIREPGKALSALTKLGPLVKGWRLSLDGTI